MWILNSVKIKTRNAMRERGRAWSTLHLYNKFREKCAHSFCIIQLTDRQSKQTEHHRQKHILLGIGNSNSHILLPFVVKISFKMGRTIPHYLKHCASWMLHECMRPHPHPPPPPTPPYIRTYSQLATNHLKHKPPQWLEEDLGLKGSGWGSYPQ